MSKNIEELILDWCQELRSGEYEQGPHYLYNPISNKYCCLGVCARMYTDEEEYFNFFKVNHYSCNLLLSSYIRSIFNKELEEIMYFLNIDEIKKVKLEIVHMFNDEEVGQTLEHYLSIMNDEGFSFDFIADLIEKIMYYDFKVDDTFIFILGHKFKK